MIPWLDDGDIRLYHGDAEAILNQLAAESAQCIVTSPPFWALRDYGVDGQIGLEPTPEAWCERLVAVFRACRRVLRDDGVLWLEVGDTYVAGQGGRQTAAGEMPAVPLAQDGGIGTGDAGSWQSGATAKMTPARGTTDLKPKDLTGTPWMLAFALRADGWYLRADVIWHRPNPMPESVTDRPTKAHSYVFLLTKSARYFYDADAIREHRLFAGTNATSRKPGHDDATVRGGSRFAGEVPAARNARSVWSIATEPTPFAHFATFPQALVERCIKAGSREGDTVLDPFMGSGTTALVARRLGRNAVGIELNEDYLRIAAKRTDQLSLLGGA